VSNKTYALVGNFGFGPGAKGLSVYGYESATADMVHLSTAFEDVNVGHQSVDTERGIVYFVDERPSLRGQTGGGGYVVAAKIDPESGNLSLINEMPSLSQEPCYTYLDKTKRYLVVSHHADFGFVTKIVRNGGGYSTETFFDDTALVLFRIEQDGSVGDACDVALTPGDGAAGPHVWSRHHAVLADPTGEMYVVCDKGLDKFHTYRLDRANGKLVHLETFAVEGDLGPRYATFHPTLPILYANYEKKPVVQGYRYDVATGVLDQMGSAPLMTEGRAAGAAKADILIHPKTLQEKMQMEKAVGDPDKAEPADILIHPSGKYLYASVRFTNTISVLDVDEAGAISLREVIDCGGVNPRGLCISPDARFLFAANMNSGNVTTFAIGADGALRATGTGAKATCPGSMRIIEV
jgi:6-phosphogluconolactonase